MRYRRRFSLTLFVKSGLDQHIKLLESLHHPSISPFTRGKDESVSELVVGVDHLASRVNLSHLDGGTSASRFNNSSSHSVNLFPPPLETHFQMGFTWPGLSPPRNKAFTYLLISSLNKCRYDNLVGQSF